MLSMQKDAKSNVQIEQSDGVMKTLNIMLPM